MGDVIVNGDGIGFEEPFVGTGDVYFGDHRGWSFVGETPGVTAVRWPKRLRTFLEGWSDVRVVADDTTLFEGRVAFTDDDREVEMKDRHGLPVIVDKWGLLQRPFDSRGEGLLGLLADESQRIMDVIEDECGLEAWISFGTLLGAARSGKAIGHDSDVDLCYVSEKTTPAEMQRELWDIARALRRAGMKLQIRGGSFLTVQVPTPDGAGAGIDVYTTFFFDGNFYETATVRTPLDRSAVLPLAPIGFEGRMLPAPADPARVLEISYGPSWRVPDPSFQHQPGPEIEDRFDGWFGKLWRQRREWGAYNRTQARAGTEPSDFIRSVLPDLAPGTRIIEVGAGTGADASYAATAGAERGLEVIALDYALPGSRYLPALDNLQRGSLNLYDLRDVLTRAAYLARRRGQQAVYARQLLESVSPDGRAEFWHLVGIALRNGGQVLVESRSWSRPALARRKDALGGRFWRTGPADARAAVAALGGVVVRVEGEAEAEQTLAASEVRAPATWRMIIEMPGRAVRPGADEEEGRS